MTRAPKISAQKKQPISTLRDEKYVPHLNCFDVTKPRYSAYNYATIVEA